MKINVLVIATLLLLASCVSGQDRRARKGKDDPGDLKRVSEKKFSEKEMEDLRKTTTVFVLREQDLDRKEEYERALSSVWTFNKLLVVPYEELNNYPRDEYAYFILDGYDVIVNGYSTSRSAGEIFLTLTYHNVCYARIELGVSNETYSKEFSMPVNKAIASFYTETSILNWSPGMLSIYLKDVDNKMKNGEREYAFREFRMKRDLKAMADDTLYIPDHILKRYNLNGKERKPYLAEKLFRSYPYSYQVENPEEISEKILSGEAQYVLDFVKVGPTFHLRIWDVKAGKKIYQDFERPEMKMRKKYIRRIL